MISGETTIRVRYGETDQMGIAYYGNYPLYYEVGRTELLRNLGLSYRKMEEEGIMLPVVSLSVKYIAPAYYDSLLKIKTILKEIPGVKIHFDYEIYDETGKLINTGETTLAFLNSKTRRPTKAPDDFIETLKKHFVASNTQ